MNEPKPIEGWKEEFDFTFPDLIDTSLYGRIISTELLQLSKTQKEALKLFISALLERQKAELKERIENEIEKSRIPFNHALKCGKSKGYDYGRLSCCGYNQELFYAEREDKRIANLKSDILKSLD